MFIPSQKYSYRTIAICIHMSFLVLNKPIEKLWTPGRFAGKSHQHTKNKKHVRPNPDVAPRLQSSWSSSSSPSPSPLPSSHHHHILIVITLKFATRSEQYVDWGNDINFIFMRGQHSPHPLNDMLVGVYNNINVIFIATWSQTRRNVRVAANMFISFGLLYIYIYLYEHIFRFNP